MVAVEGDTYPVKDELKALGARWDKDGRVWMVPESKSQEAAAIVANQAPQTPGVCAKCGAACNAPYTLCLRCKPAKVWERCKECGAAASRYVRIYRNGVCSGCYRDAREEAEMGY